MSADGPDRRSPPPIAVIGLGIMGGAICGHLANAGLQVFGCDPDPAAARAARAMGAILVEDVAAASRAAPVLITSLPSAKAAFAMAQGLTSTGARPSTVIEMSTLSLEDKLRLQPVLERAGHVALDCPISGTGAQMSAKDVVVFTSGPAEAKERVRPILQHFSRRQFDFGAFGGGSRMKLVANHLVAIHNLATAEALGLARAVGLDLETAIEAIVSGAADSRIFQLRAPMIVEGRFAPPTMKLSVWEKDMAAIAALAEAFGKPTPLFDAAAPLYAAALAMGLGELDTAAVSEALEALPRRPPSPLGKHVGGA